MSDIKQSKVIAGAIVTDGRGRQLVLRELDVLEESRLIRAVGADSQNIVYMNGYVIPAVIVGSIDGEECELPATGRQIEAAIKRVGADGIKAVLNYIGDVTGGEERDGLKNS